MNKLDLIILIGSALTVSMAIGYILLALKSSKALNDIQQSKLLELAKSEQRYKSLFDNSLSGMMKFDPVTRLVYDANQSILKIFECENNISLHDSLFRIPEDKYLQIQDALREHNLIEELEIEMTRLNGQILWILFSARHIPADALSHAVVLDITEKKRLENVYFRAQKMEAIALLTNSLAHDLQNILVPVLLSVNLLKKQISTAEGKTILQATKESANKGLKLVKNILSIGRGVRVEWKRVHIGHLIDHSIHFCNQKKKRSIKIISPSKRHSIYVIGEESQLSQAFLNLLHNAKEAMPNGGTITVEIKTNPPVNVLIDAGISSTEVHFVWISFSDTGGGISKVNLQRIFEPFFTTKEGTGGTGLGLSIVHSIIKNHDGYISVKSELNRGTTFNIFLPIAGD